MPSPQRQQGFALVLALWMVALLVILISGYVLLMRGEVRLAGNLAAAASAEALADAGIELGLADVRRAARDPSHARRFPLTGQNVTCVVSGQGTLEIEVRDEAGRIDLNAAGLPILEALFAGLGEPDRAGTLAAAIFDYRDPDDERRPEGAEREDYAGAGLSWGPKNARFAVVEELSQVLGFEPELAQRAAPYLTVHSGQSGFAPAAAPAGLVDILKRGIEGRAAALASFPELDTDVALPAIFISPMRGRIISVMSTARSDLGATYARQAMVSVGGGSGGTSSFDILAWRRVDSVGLAKPAHAGTGGAC